MGSVALIGLPGSGKSTLGRLLAEKLDRAFVDIDEEIERASSRTIPQLFAEGERVFRDLESEQTRLYCGKDAVLSCGGGVVKRRENVEALRKGGLVIFLDRPIERILADIDVSGRPLLADGRERLIALNRERRALYLTAAHKVVANDGDTGAALDALARAVRAWESAKP